MALQPGQRAPNYINPETHEADVVIVGTVFTFLAAIAVVLRFYAHVRARISAPDDIVITLAWLSSLANTIMTNISSLKYGWNRHFIDIPLEWIKSNGAIGYSSRIVYVLAIACTRCSILIFYHRLTVGMAWTRAYRISLHVAVLAVVIVGVVQLGMTIFQCTPIRTYWAFPPVPRSQCREEAHELFTFGVSSCFLDATLVAWPLPMVWKAPMSLHKRLEAVAILGVGFIATISTCLRTYFIYRLWKWKGIPDPSWQVHPAYIASIVELNLGIICSCAPHIRPLIKHWRKACANRQARASDTQEV